MSQVLGHGGSLFQNPDCVQLQQVVHCASTLTWGHWHLQKQNGEVIMVLNWDSQRSKFNRWQTENISLTVPSFEAMVLSCLTLIFSDQFSSCWKGRSNFSQTLSSAWWFFWIYSSTADFIRWNLGHLFFFLFLISFWTYPQILHGYPRVSAVDQISCFWCWIITAHKHKSNSSGECFTCSYYILCDVWLIFPESRFLFRRMVISQHDLLPCIKHF